MLEQEYYVPLYRIASSMMLSEQNKIKEAEAWLIQNSKNIDLKKVKAAFKRAKRDDLVSYFIDDVDIKIGDKVRSRYTGRFGKVVKESWDKEHVVVSWDNDNGQQLICKGLLVKMSEVNEKGIKPGDMSLVKQQFEPYENMLDNKKTNMK
jgi:hypothetical protein